MIPMNLWFVCMHALYRTRGYRESGLWAAENTFPTLKDPELRNTIPVVRYENRKLTCFYFSRETLAEWMKPSPKLEVFFTEPDPPYKRIDDLVPGERFRIAVVFDRAQQNSTETVTLTTEGGRDAKRFVAWRTEDLKVFRSGPIRLISKRIQP